MGRFLGILVVGAIVSSYFFPFSFTFLPTAINTKLMLAVLSVPLYILENVRSRDTSLSRNLLGATLLAALFSFVCLVSVDYNKTSDYSYVSYLFSFFTWLGGAYTTCVSIRAKHHTVSIKIITSYLAGVAAAQCALAIIIDQVPAIQAIVDAVVYQGNEYLHEIQRLYGIGASLDTAGSRFSVVLIMIASVLTQDKTLKQNKKEIWLFLLAFFIIAIIGNIMSRTTTAGLAIGLIIFLLSSGVHRLIITAKNVRLYGILSASLVLVAVVLIYLYRTDAYFHNQLRFGFEGFFSWLETGVWRTDSTDKLHAVMWIWPTDMKTWIIGSGLYGNFVYSTDIGYCRLVLYCGLVGFGIFAFFFIYNPAIFAIQYPHYRLMFFALMCLTFIIWLKVSTDIFLVYALLFGIRETDKAFALQQTRLTS